jgi:putative FmdB family regulatory protein
MPTYEYRCDACEHQFDEFQSMKDEPLKDCPKCGKSALRRLFGSGAAIIFKGSGFYQTDYRSESYKAAAKADKPAGDGGKPTSDGGGKSSSGDSGGSSTKSSGSTGST